MVLEMVSLLLCMFRCFIDFSFLKVLYFKFCKLLFDKLKIVSFIKGINFIGVIVFNLLLVRFNFVSEIRFLNVILFMVCI